MWAFELVEKKIREKKKCHKGGEDYEVPVGNTVMGRVGEEDIRGKNG